MWSRFNPFVICCTMKSPANTPVYIVTSVHSVHSGTNVHRSQTGVQWYQSVQLWRHFSPTHPCDCVIERAVYASCVIVPLYNVLFVASAQYCQVLSVCLSVSYSCGLD